VEPAKRQADQILLFGTFGARFYAQLVPCALEPFCYEIKISSRFYSMR